MVFVIFLTELEWGKIGAHIYIFLTKQSLALTIFPLHPHPHSPVESLGVVYVEIVMPSVAAHICSAVVLLRLVLHVTQLLCIPTPTPKLTLRHIIMSDEVT